MLAAGVAAVTVVFELFFDFACSFLVIWILSINML